MKPLRWLSLLACVVWVVAARPLAGAALDGSLPQTVALGPPDGPAPMAGLNAARSGWTRFSIPDSPSVLWRTRIDGGVSRPPVVDRGGRIVLCHVAARVSELDAQGRPLWTLRTGAHVCATSPALGNAGQRWLLTRGAELIAVSPAGTLLSSSVLPAPVPSAPPELLPLVDGGLALALGRELVRVDAGGRVQAHARVDTPVLALLEHGEDVLFISVSGSVYRWPLLLDPRPIGNLAGVVDSAALAGNALIAVVDKARLVELNVKTGQRSRRTLPPAMTPNGGLAVLPNGGVRLSSADGFLLGLRKNGRELLRVMLEPNTPVLSRHRKVASIPMLFVDDFGRMATVLPGQEVSVVLPSGEMRSAVGALCGDPLGLVPADERRLLLTCGSGALFLIGQSPTAPSRPDDGTPAHHDQ